MSERKVVYSIISSGSDLGDATHEPYPALVWNTIPAVSADQIGSLMERLLVSGCRYIVAAGIECERWHDIADEMFVEQFPSKHEQDANFLMTSWHTNESPEEVTFFLFNATNFEAHDFKEFFIFQFGEDSAIEMQLRMAIKKLRPLN